MEPLGNSLSVNQNQWDVVLVSMPFSVCVMPPIGICGLKTVLDNGGVRARVRHFNLEFLPFIFGDLDLAQSIHDEISYLWDFLPGEWLFSPPGSPDADDAFLVALRRDGQVRIEIIDVLRRLRPRISEFVELCAERIAADQPQIVGFTSSFMQNQASLAVCRALKRIMPKVQVIFGGSNTFGEMGKALVEQYPEIDVVVRGEAERSIVPVVHALASNDVTKLTDIFGICFRGPDGITTTPDALAQIPIDEVPIPDFSDYFVTLRALRRTYPGGAALPLFLPIETSRGCWWGEKSHCTFCGLNADRMNFRSRTPEAAFEYITEIRRRYGVKNLFAVDNIIDHKYYDTVLEKLAASGESYFIHYEIKSNLKRSQVDQLARSGVGKVQPGIESLSTPVLKLMRKGVTSLQNIQTLKLLTEAGIKTSWFLLYGFPGEEIAWYREMAHLIPKLRHIVPPGELAPVYLERFSPYQTTPEAFGIEVVGPTRWYRMAFPEVPAERLGRLAYRFDFEDPSRSPDLDAFVAQVLRPQVRAWKQSFASSGANLHVLHGPKESTIIVGPLAKPERLLRIAGPLRTVLINSDTARAEHALFEPPDRDAVRLHVDGELYDRFLSHSSGIRDERGMSLDLTSEGAAALLENQGLLLREAGAALALPLACGSPKLEALLAGQDRRLVDV